jgi:hypothetical protein
VDPSVTAGLGPSRYRPCAIIAAFVLLALLPLIASGLPGMPGVIGPFWLVAVSVGLARSRRFA